MGLYKSVWFLLSTVEWKCGVTVYEMIVKLHQFSIESLYTM